MLDRDQVILAVVLVVVVVWLLGSSIRILKEHERAVIFRLGRLARTRGPGLVVLAPAIDRMVRVSLRPMAMDVAPQDVLTRDNVWVKVGVAVHIRVKDPERAILAVEDHHHAVAKIAQAAVRSGLDRVYLEDLVRYREKTGERLRQAIAEEAEPLGVEVTGVEVKQVEVVRER